MLGGSHLRWRPTSDMVEPGVGKHGFRSGYRQSVAEGELTYGRFMAVGYPRLAASVVSENPVKQANGSGRDLTDTRRSRSTSHKPKVPSYDSLLVPPPILFVDVSRPKPMMFE